MRFGSSIRATTGGPVPAHTPLPDKRWQQIWFAAMRRPCSSMALVPARPGTSALFVAEGLASVGHLHGDRPVKLIDAEKTELPEVAEVGRSLAAVGDRLELAVVVTDCPLSRPASIAVARLAEAAVLVIPLGETGFSEARRAMDLVGRDRFIGAVTLERRSPA